MTQYNQPNFGQGNYTYGNMNHWGTPSGRVPISGISAENPLTTGLSPDTPYLGGMDDLNRNLEQTYGGFGVGNAPITPGYSMPEMTQTNIPAGYKPPGSDEPEVAGQWIEPAKIGLGTAKVGLMAYNAFQSAKMNKSMQSYYDAMRDRQDADFLAGIRTTNNAIEGQRERQLDSQGIAAGSDENKARVASYMKSHGVSGIA